MNEFVISISKEAIADMPVTTFSGPITLVETAATARTALRALAKEAVVGFDTETRPSFRKGQLHNMALMQISTPERCFLFRINKIGISDELKAFIENPSVLKIGLSLQDDFSVLRRSTQCEPQGFVDLQKMVKDFEITDTSLKKIYAILFGRRISKAQRLTNWEADSLTPQQQAYAALDAVACLDIYNLLKSGGFDPALSPWRHLRDDERAKA